VPEDVVVVGVGMISAVGLSTAETAASVRAGTARFTETSMLDHRFEPFVLAEVPEDGLPDLAEGLEGMGLTAREARMLRLATPALTECVKALPAGEPAPALVLALPETETTKPMDGATFLTRLARQVGATFDVKGSDASQRGRAGGLAALGQAAEAIRTGRAKFMLAGGIDTYRDTYVLGTLDAIEKRVKSAANLDGFIPGEAAGFVLLAARSPAANAAMALVSPVFEAIEPGHLYSKEPYRGEGLSLAVQQLVTSGVAKGQIQEVYSSMNGESHWAKEWGVARIRQNGRFSAEHGMYHPADCFGDTGAACGPLLVGLAAVGVVRDSRRACCLVYCSSDHGQRAVLVVTAA